MPTEIINSNTPQGGGNNYELHAENQEAKTILNVNNLQGGININNYAVRKETKLPNKFLCRNLIEAIQEYSPAAKNFLEYDIDDSERADWEEPRYPYLNKAKEIIISSYASVLGGFFQNLMGCTNPVDYYDLSQKITKRTLQLVCFSFISKLWDQPAEKIQQVTPDLKKLRKLFFTSFEPGILYYADLFATLAGIFRQLQIEYPFAEIKSMESDFDGDKTFIATCKKIDDFRVKFGEDPSSLSVDEIEKALTSFLVALNFLASYKMVSVKGIGYDSVRNNAAKFLHIYTPLGENISVNRTSKADRQIYSYQDTAANTDAVLLIKDTYPEGLSLFPFIIDINALKDENLVKICFYAWNDENDKTLVYYDLNKSIFDENMNDMDEIIKKNEELEDIEKKITEIIKSQNKDITSFKENGGDKYKKMKLYEVYNTFINAKETFFGK